MAIKVIDFQRVKNPALLQLQLIGFTVIDKQSQAFSGTTTRIDLKWGPY